MVITINSDRGVIQMSYTIGLVYLALYITNKIIALSLTITSVVVVAGVGIAVIGGRKTNE